MLRFVFSYEEYSLNEDDSREEYLSSITKEIFDKIISTKATPNDYVTIIDKEYDKPTPSEVKVEIKKEVSPDLKEDPHFKDNPWEKHNLEDHGFVIDANTLVKDEDYDVALIEVFILIDPEREPESHKELYYRLHDIIAHEFHHAEDFDTPREKEKLSRNPEMLAKRKEAKDSHEYFLLKDEIPAMIAGMNKRSIIENKPLDQVFAEYFEPFIKYGFITDDQYKDIMRIYIEYAMEHKPNARFSNKAKTFLEGKV